MEPRLTGVVSWSKASAVVSIESNSDMEKKSENHQSKKRPRDLSSAAVDIAAEKVTEIANIAASSSRKKIALSRAKSSSEEIKRSEKGKKKDQVNNSGRGRGKDKEKEKDKGRGASKSPASTKQVSFTPPNTASNVGKAKNDAVKTKNNVYYSARRS